MRSTFVDAATRYMAQKMCPWAVKTIRVDGGFHCFESIQDYKTWRHQK